MMTITIARPRIWVWTLLLTSALLTVACARDAGPAISAPEAFAAAQAGNMTIIDIRTPQEWRQTGVAAGVERINMVQPGGPQGFAAAVRESVEGDKAAPIALICRTGNRSSHMQRFLLEQGFTNVYNVEEGMAGSGAGPGWIARGLPVEPCHQC